jgi:PhoH-like ATPase
MIKNYVLDTNVLLHDPGALFEFEDNRVIVPIYVLEEIDKFKRDGNELGRAARTVSRTLDELRGLGQLSQGVTTKKGGVIRVAFSNARLPAEVATTANEIDSRIVATALAVLDAEPETPCILVSKDVNLRVRADVLGLRAEDYETDRTDISELYAGVSTHQVGGDLIDALYGDGRIETFDEALGPNEFVHLVDATNPQHTGMGRVSPDRESVLPIPRRKKAVWGIVPRNREQQLAFELLLDDRLKLVTLVGKAGTGKTLLALAAALLKAKEEKMYERVLVSRPVFPLGKDLGYLPGTLEEKLHPWMKPIFDNLELLMGLTAEEKRHGRSYEEMLDLGMLEVEPLTYIRGRSIPNQYLIVDEAQNLTPHEVKTIVTRAGENTKIVLTGDPYQVDNPYMDASSNGLVHVVNRFRGSAIAGHITLTKGERSELAEEAANRL